MKGDFHKGQINDLLIMIDVSLSKSFLNPKSVAIIGASADPKKTSSRAQRFLVSHGYKGKIFPVNPNREKIFGLKCYPNLKSINEHIDHIFVAVNGNKIIEVVSSSTNKGIASLDLFKEDDFDFTFVAGDDTTDENMFIHLPKDVFSVKVGNKLTSAKYFVNEHTDILKILKLIEDK